MTIQAVGRGEVLPATRVAKDNGSDLAQSIAGLDDIIGARKFFRTLLTLTSAHLAFASFGRFFKGHAGLGSCGRLYPSREPHCLRQVSRFRPRPARGKARSQRALLRSRRQ